MATYTKSKLYELSVCEMADAVVKGELTPTDLVESSLERIEALESRIQAWSYMDTDALRALAAKMTSEAVAGKLRGPLHGVPVAIKDEFHVQGMPTGMEGPGGGALKAEDATPVARLRAAGAIIMGKTYMPVGSVLPPTHNPWNLEHTAGGSSSGSGAAVGARMVPIALGEQTGGSNLRPAAYCGIEGLKPTFGRISRFGCYPFSYSFDHPGIIGLAMADIALVFSIIAGPDPKDPTSLMDPAPPADLKISEIRPPRIGLVTNFFPERTEPVMQEAVEKSAARLKEAGAKVINVALPDEFGLTWMVQRLTSGPEGASFRAASPHTASLRDVASAAVPATYYLQAQRIRRWLYDKVQTIFGDFDALLMAVAPGPAPKGLHTTGDAILLSPWSCLGYPAITLNGGLSPEGLPLGLQFVGAPKMEFGLMQAGTWCEDVLGRLSAPPIS